MTARPRVGAHPDADETCPVPSPGVRRVFTGGVLVVGGLVLLTLLAAVPSNALFARDGSDPLRALRDLAPQEWAFFTGSPRGPVLLVYQQVDGAWRQVSASSAGEPGRMFGLDRTARTERTEIAALARQAEDVSWTECARAPVTDCLPDVPAPAASVTAHGTRPRFCGAVALVRWEPVPWARARTAEETPSSVKILHVRCSEPPRQG
ncbi:SdpA family antimicrobial peptide system protein [Marinactinospora rubrisoli]|uniref:SdpA family antimicrobial peptide system protein n=1 Tax=Marinactinospora rubrisoli TaxID=2715399 RepID=A0ABW2KB35_9ACTN